MRTLRKLLLLAILMGCMVVSCSVVYMAGYNKGYDTAAYDFESDEEASLWDPFPEFDL